MIQHFIFLIVFCALIAPGAAAEVSNPNPNATLSVVGNNPNPWILFRTPGQVLEEGFAIKLVSPSGEPLRGLTVHFGVAAPLIVGGLPQILPPDALYGRFASGLTWVSVDTDDEGIARSGSFRGGSLSGSYQIGVGIYAMDSTANLVALGKFPGPRADFQITQVLGAPQAVIDLSAGPPVGPTLRCNTGASSEIVLSGLSNETTRRIRQAVERPAKDPALYSRLWAPRQARVQNFTSVVLSMDPLQDLPEMATSIRADPLVAALGFSSVQYHADSCVAFSPPSFQRITEYYNIGLKHYFLSSSEAENASIESGRAGPGWVRTGESFLASPPNTCGLSDRVFRFYGPGPNSHFYTADPNECGGLRTQKSGWNAEGVAFGAKLPQNGLCPSALYTPVYRLYNNRWMFNDSNHRYTIKPDIYQQMIAQGWIGEGVALCVRDGK